MRAKTNYIPCDDCFKNYSIFKEHPTIFIPKDKVPIEDIKLSKKYPNPLIEEEVGYIVDDFCIEGWEPIWIDQNNSLTDGQHRIAAAKRMGLKYVDVIIEDLDELARVELEAKSQKHDI
jgi:hypothetical protein